MPKLADLIATLRKHYGPPKLPPARGPFELVLWENAVYLLPDERRAEVFEALRTRVGLTAKAIAEADGATLLELAKRGGMRPETRVFRWREIARITLGQFDGDLNQILKLPYAQARRALKQFPTIADPGAEKVLLMCGVAEGLPLESNGLRTLTRIGYGRELKQYGATYKSVQEAIAPELPRQPKTLLAAHVLLREHGKTLCKAKDPLCDPCPVRQVCAFGKQHGSPLRRAGL
jgi:endonuclease III